MSLVGGTIVTMEDGAVLSRGSVVIDDGVVQAVVDREFRHGEVIDCRGRVVLPGLVNLHAHTSEALFRGVGGDLGLLRWLPEVSHPLTAALDDAGARAAVRLAALEMLRSGTTAFLDPEVMPVRAATIADAIADVGLRAGLAIALGDLGGYGGDAHHHPPSVGATTQGTVEALRAVSRPPRVDAWLGPRVLSAVSADLAAVIRDAREGQDTRLTFHCAEVREDVAAVRRWTGLGPAEHALALGLLGPATTIAHGVFLDDHDMDILAGSGTHLAHCPTSNAKTGAGIAPVLDMLARGVDVALGTDGGSCNDTYDLVAEMRVAALMQRAAHRDAGAVKADTLVEIATRSGARAMGLDAGRLAPGALGDCVVIDLRRDGSWPTLDPLHSFVFGCGRAGVEAVVVGGDVLLADGQPTALVPSEVLREAGEAAAAALERSGLAGGSSPSWWRVEAQASARA